MKKILVPTDFSANADSAYQLAAQIAKKNNASIVLFHITIGDFEVLMNLSYPFVASALTNYSPDENLQEVTIAKNKLADLAGADVFADVTVETEVFNLKKDSVAESIIEAINAEHYGMVVMATEGDEGEGDSVAQVVTRFATIPVITIKNEQENYSLENIVLCTDFKNISRKFTHLFKSFADAMGAKITVLYVNTPKHFLETNDIITSFKRFKRMYNMKGVKLSIYDAYKVENGIKGYLKKNETDMLALSTHGRTGLAHYFLGSYTDDIIAKAKIPVYTYNLHDYIESKIHYEGSSTANSGGFVG